MRFDFLVIGAGIAGASAAYELARYGTVAVLEREPSPGMHSTGRSAALFSQIYGNAPVRALSRASRASFFAPPPGFSAVPLVRPRGALFVALDAERAAFDAWREDPDVAAGTAPLSRDEAVARVPVLAHAAIAAAAYEWDAHDLDVDALLQAYLRGLRARGGLVQAGAECVALSRSGDAWLAETRAGTYSAPVLVNAAGAWADRVAALAGVAPVGLVPKRRTALLVRAPEGHAIDAWPMVIDAAESVYFKPDAGRLLVSPADETPCEPCDAQPDDLDVAVAVDRFERLTGLEVRRVESQWAGLRSFVADKSPVIGFDDRTEGFFWLAAQGGYGIQTAPAAARCAAALAAGRAVPDDILAHGVEPQALAPARLRDR